MLSPLISVYTCKELIINNSTTMKSLLNTSFPCTFPPTSHCYLQIFSIPFSCSSQVFRNTLWCTQQILIVIRTYTVVKSLLWGPWSINNSFKTLLPIWEACKTKVTPHTKGQCGSLDWVQMSLIFSPCRTTIPTTKFNFPIPTSLPYLSRRGTKLSWK